MYAAAVARLPQPLETGQLFLRNRLIDIQNLDRRLVDFDEVIHPDDHLLSPFDGLLEFVRALGNFPLRESTLDCLDHAAHPVDLIEVRGRLLLHLARQLLDEIRPAQRVDHVRHARLEGDDLLRPERQGCGILRRQCERLVERVRMQ